MTVAELARKAQQAPAEMTAVERAMLVLHQGMSSEKEETKLRAAAAVAQVEAINQRDELANRKKAEQPSIRVVSQTPAISLHEFVRKPGCT